MSSDSDSTEFQKAKLEKLKAIYQMGLGFEADGALELADQNYREALELVEPEDKANFKALHYRLGRVAEALGKLEAAEKHYNVVAVIDYK
jgi:tetratricopeptide (TPR) repeat protein